MRTVLPFSRRPRALVVTLVAATILSLTGCGSSEEAGADLPDLPEATAPGDAPAEALPQCKAAYPTAFSTPDIADVAMLPGSWPAPPPGSTLCQTSETLGGSREQIDYASELAPEEVFAAYEAALDPSYGVARQESGLGDEVLVGAADGLDFQISAAEGKFSIALAK